MRILRTSVLGIVGSTFLSACAAVGGAPVAPHDHGRDKTGAPTTVLTDKDRVMQRCRVMMAEMERGPSHDHGREKTGAPTPPARPHDPTDPTHEMCREMMAQQPRN